MPAHAWGQQPALAQRGQVFSQAQVLAHGCDALAPELAWQVKARHVLAHALSPLYQPQLMLSLALVLHPLQVTAHEIKLCTPDQVALGRLCVRALLTHVMDRCRSQTRIIKHPGTPVLTLLDWLRKLEKGAAP